MNIAIDLPHNGRRGIARYAEELVCALVRRFPNDRFIAYRLAERDGGLLAGVTAPNLEHRTVEAASFAAALGRDHPDVLHLMEYCHPFFNPSSLLVPELSGMRIVASVFDMIPLLFPGHYAPLAAQMQDYFRPLIAGTAVFLVDSHSVRNDALRLWGIAPWRVAVSYPAVDRSLFHPGYSQPQVDEAVQRHSLQYPYFLYVGGVDWRKNVPGLIRGFSRFLQNRPDSAALLALAGAHFTPGSPAFAGAVARLVNSCGLSDRVRYLGYVARNDLPLLYRGAVGLVLPSFYEGFGLPLLEAMSCGTPVVGGRNSSQVEVVGGHGLLVDPESPYEIASAMEQICDTRFRGMMVQLGLRRAAEFKVDNMADEVMGVYRRVVA